MARQLDQGLQREGMRLKLRLLRVSQGMTLRNALETAAEMRRAAEGYKSMASQIGELPEAEAASLIAGALLVGVQLCEWSAATLDAAPDARRHLTAARAGALATGEEVEGLGSFPPMRAALMAWLTRVSALDDIGGVKDVVRALALVPLPVFYSLSKDPWETRGFAGEAGQEKEEERGPAVVKVLFTLDGLPWLTPQAIRSQVQYDIGAEVSMLSWPERLPSLEIDFVSTGLPESYALTPIHLSRQGTDAVKVLLRSNLIVHHGQSLLSDPVTLKTRARLVSEDRAASLPVEVIGHPELQLRALDPTAYPVLTTYPTIDIQIPRVLQEARAALPTISPQDFDDFTRVLIYLARYAGMVQQSGVFKGKKISEVVDFQQDLLRHLRMTDLGSEVREGGRVAGGILDLHYRNVVIELKVEDKIADRAALRIKYIEQPAQYTAPAVPLSVACILDMVAKEHPPANVANNITLETPSLHGFAKIPPAYPSKVAVIIIDGNLRSPSDYS